MQKGERIEWNEAQHLINKHLFRHRLRLSLEDSGKDSPTSEVKVSSLRTTNTFKEGEISSLDLPRRA